MNKNPMEDLQKIRLTEKEFTFCKKLNEKVSKMPYATQSQKDDVFKFITAECKGKHKIAFRAVPTKDNYEVHEFSFNDKPCYIAFDKANKGPVNIIPSGIVMLENEKSD